MRAERAASCGSTVLPGSRSATSRSKLFRFYANPGGNRLILHAQSHRRSVPAPQLRFVKRTIVLFFGMIDLAKGDRTRARILDEAVDLASVQGSAV